MHYKLFTVYILICDSIENIKCVGRSVRMLCKILNQAFIYFLNLSNLQAYQSFLLNKSFRANFIICNKKILFKTHFCAFFRGLVKIKYCNEDLVFIRALKHPRRNCI